jgi:hypothetical protein
MSHALVFGASGLAGWGVVDQILSNYPATGTFSKITALVNRPLAREQSGWPESTASRPALNLVCGVNLLEGTIEEFTKMLEEKVDNVEGITHMFYFGQFLDSK